MHATRITEYPLGTLGDFIRDQVLGFVVEALDTFVPRNQWPPGNLFQETSFYGGRSPPFL